MNFFEHQDQARRQTGRLVFLFLLAVICLIALANLLVVLVLAYLGGVPVGDNASAGTVPMTAIINHFRWDTLLAISIGIVAIVLLASLYKLAQLRGGGHTIAEAMGGRLIVTNTDNAAERRILNVVEEMAIASGTAVPPVYLIEEEGINAFAAGYSPADAVIGITRGCIELLDRDELQGVIAHEFSHILHGDMRLNIRLIGVLHGILVIGIIGHHLLRSVSRSGYRSRSGKNGGALPFLVLGGGLMAIGYVGTFFGNLIKAAVSRQREFLADASAVQFTRNPEGIGGALKKIGGAVAGSEISHPNAGEVSHLFFGQAISSFFGSMLATHPPLPERIRRVDPQWDGRFSPAQGTTPSMSADPEGVSRFSATVQVQGSSTEQLLASVGEVDTDHLDYAGALLGKLPDDVMGAAHEPFGARALIYCLLLDSRSEIAEQQWRQLQQHADPMVYQLTRQLYRSEIVQPEMRLPLLDLCLPALKQLSQPQYRVFKSNLALLMKADNRIELYEWALYRIVLHHMEPKPVDLLNSGRVGSFKTVAKATGLVLSALASAGAESEEAAMAAFANGKELIGLPRLRFIRPGQYRLQDLSRAVTILNRLKPLLKPRLLKALCGSVSHDGVIKPLEVELVRAFADALDCPMPPLLINTH